jgi:hypothetical protein
MSSLKRVRKYLIPTLLIVILAVSILAIYVSYSSGNQPKANPNAYVGVAFCGNTTAEAKLLIDKVKSYTNLFVLDSGRNPISRNQSSVEEICDYAVSNGLSVIINLGINDVLEINETTWFWQQPLNSTKQRWTDMWGDKFLGIYYNDEPGGIQLDGNWSKWFSYWGQRLNQINNNVNSTYHPLSDDLYQIYLKMWDVMNNGTKPQDYNLEAKFFVQDALKIDPGLGALNAAGITAYTSDYGLYWFDYLGGYNVLFTELGWNCSVAEQIALVKGAARLQDKEWGAIITWKYDSAPYLDSGDQIYNQMLTSYQAGAKYIVIFNYPYVEGNNYGAMSDDQFIALQRFWNDITQKKFTDLSTPQAALVLPKNFGWGMRNPNDTIWGFWTTDDKTQQIAIATSKLLAQYGASLDIVYDDSTYPITNVGYKNVYYWNSTDI